MVKLVKALYIAMDMPFISSRPTRSSYNCEMHFMTQCYKSTVVLRPVGWYFTSIQKILVTSAMTAETLIPIATSRSPDF